MTATDPGTIYLIHFDRPYRHARHYLGWAKDLEARLRHHRAGSGANLLRVINEAGIAWRVVRTWTGDRNMERRMKARAVAECCPECRLNPRYARLAQPPVYLEVDPDGRNNR